MNEHDFEQKFDEILMFIYAGNIRSGKNYFERTVNKAVNKKLDRVIEILEQNEAGHLLDQIRELKNNQ